MESRRFMRAILSRAWPVADDLRGLPGLPRKAPSRARPHVCHQSGPETGEARAAVAADARIHDTEGAGLQQRGGKHLRGKITLRVEAGPEAASLTQVVEVRPEVREVLVLGDGFVGRSNLGEFDGLVKCDLGLGGVELKRGIPGATVGAVEA